MSDDWMKGARVCIGCMAGIILLMLVELVRVKARGSEDGTVLTDTVTVTLHNTVEVVKPAPIETRALPGMVVMLPRWVAPDMDVASKKQVADSASVAPIEDYLCKQDSVAVVAPIEQNVYTDSTSYRAVITGAWVSLDTMEVWNRHEITTIRHEVTRPDRRRWSIGIGVGYGITPHGFQPYIGITASYTLFRL